MTATLQPVTLECDLVVQFSQDLLRKHFQNISFLSNSIFRVFTFLPQKPSRDFLRNVLWNVLEKAKNSLKMNSALHM